MHAIIRQGDGKYYLSAVFGCYLQDEQKSWGFFKKTKKTKSPYYIIWDENKEHLIQWFVMDPKRKVLTPQALIIDASEKDWILNEDETGGVNFLPKELADQIIRTGEMSQEIRNQCLAVDEGFVYEEYPEIRTAADIKNLQYAAFDFHDAYIKEKVLQSDGNLYLLFDGIWGCKIEVWLWGDLEYDTSSRDSKDCDPYWFCSTILLQDGFVYFIDDDDVTIDEMKNGCCWFKARHMKYHIIPD